MGHTVAQQYGSASLPCQPGTWLAYAQSPFHLLWSGVDCFFVLAGSLIGGILMETGWSGRYLPTFYARISLNVHGIAAIALPLPPLLGELSWRYFEKPFVRLGHRLTY